MHVHTVTLAGTSISVAYVDLPGSSMMPPRVFIHGLGSSSIATFPEHAIQKRLDGPRALLVDLPGFGSSFNAPTTWSFSIEDQADLVATFLADLGIGPATIIGHSLGGSIAIALAHRHSGQIANLIVAEPNLDPGIGQLSKHIAKQSEAAFVARGHGMLIRAITQQANRGDDGSVIFLPTIQQALPVALHRSSVSLLAERTPTFREMLLQLAGTMQTTFIAGEHGPDLTGLDDLAAAGVTIITIPGAGHSMMDDNPDAFVAAILDAEHRSLAS